MTMFWCSSFTYRKGILKKSKVYRSTLRYLRTYHPFENHYACEITIFELFRGLQLQLSGVHYSYSFLAFSCRTQLQKIIPHRNSQELPAITVT